MAEVARVLGRMLGLAEPAAARTTPNAVHKLFPAAAMAAMVLAAAFLGYRFAPALLKRALAAFPLRPPQIRASTPGAIAISVQSAHSARCLLQIFRGDQRVAEHSFPPGIPFICASPVSGPHRLIVAQQGYRWRAERVVDFQSGSTNPISIYFGNKNVALVSDPHGASVQWSPATIGNSAEAIGGTRIFETEVPYTFRFQKDGHRVVETNVVFQGPERGLLSVKLALITAPQFGPKADLLWTNSHMGMVFRLFGNLRVCTTETTVGQFRKFANAAGRHDLTNGMFSMTFTGRRQAGFSWLDPGFPQTDAHPVIGVSEADARAFCEWLTKAAVGDLDSGQVYRIPTQAEWEAFSGAGRYPWGDGEAIVGNFSGREVFEGKGIFRWPPAFPVLSGYDDKWFRTAAVTENDAVSRTGLSFVAGNAAEWCQGGVVCGGSWFDGENLPPFDKLQTLLTGALVQQVNPDERDDRHGFRVVIAQKDEKR